MALLMAKVAPLFLAQFRLATPLFTSQNSIDFNFSSPHKKKFNTLSRSFRERNERFEKNRTLEYKKNLEARLQIIEEIKALINVNQNINTTYNAFKNLQKNRDYISEKNLSKYLLTKNIPDPDILIRTGNTKRLSNFLLWQLAYTEIFFEKKLWPDFNERDYNRVIKKFKNVKRNFGNI